MSTTALFYRTMTLIPLLLSLGVHEWAHAIVAFRLGDPTAEEQGRLTLNPLLHVDLVGTLLLPLLGVPFGWAKPVPVDPSRFREDVSMDRGMWLTAAAGPASNAVLAALCVLIAAIARRLPVAWAAHPALAFLLAESFVMNVSLAIFNLLPIPPLDGGRVFDALVPFEWRGAWERVSAHGWAVLVVVCLVLNFVGLSPYAWATAVAERWAPR